MARQELRKPIDTLLNEKNKLDGIITSIKDRYDRFHEELNKLRYEQHSYREGKETLQNSNQNKPARRVFDQQIAECQKRIEEVLKELDNVEKERVVQSSKLKAIEKSIKELQNA
jgi:chromosome segregation ATPase